VRSWGGGREAGVGAARGGVALPGGERGGGGGRACHSLAQGNLPTPTHMKTRELACKHTKSGMTTSSQNHTTASSCPALHNVRLAWQRGRRRDGC
jgi:hypothetical protein